MAFLGGPECSTSGNPIGQLHKVTGDDRTLQQDRLVGPGPGPALGGFRTAGALGPQDQAMNQFLNGPSNLHQALPPNLLLHHPPGAAVTAAPNWATDFRAAAAHVPMGPALGAPAGPATMMASTTGSFGPQDLSHFAQMGRHGPAAPAGLMHTEPARRLAGMGTPGMGFGVVNQPLVRPLYAQPSYHHHYPPHQQQQPHDYAETETETTKGKGKQVASRHQDEAWEAQFSQLELREEGLASGDEREEALDDVARASQDGGDFEAIWKGIQEEAVANQSLDDWLQVGDDEKGESRDVGRFVDDGGSSADGNYMFEQDNIFEHNRNAFDEGLRIVGECGNLSLAALAFEAAVMQKPDHVEAWVYLGSVQAQNEKETAAIRALEQALKLDPGNLAALMGLAVSYTNEGFETKAYRSLERWLAARYPQVPDPASAHPLPGDVGFTDRQELHDSVTRNFIRAAQLSPSGQEMDPDVQVGLGVLFYGAEEYDKAVDCFQAALDSSRLGTSNRRDQLHLLWNRLGATLANSGRPEQAVSAYQQALNINPNFVRARYNLGVSCLNINCHEEAVGHLLSALAMHKSIEKSGRLQAYEILANAGGGGDRSSGSNANKGARAAPSLESQLDWMVAQNVSTTLYDTLRRVFILMGRRDLAEKTVSGVDPEIFRPEFDF